MSVQLHHAWLVGGAGLALDVDGTDTPVVIRLTQGDIERLALMLERATTVDMDTARALLAATEEQPVDTEQVGQGGREIRALAREWWRTVPAVVELWPDPDGMPATVNVDLARRWSEAIAADPFGLSSPARTLTATISDR